MEELGQIRMGNTIYVNEYFFSIVTFETCTIFMVLKIDRLCGNIIFLSISTFYFRRYNEYEEKSTDNKINKEKLCKTLILLKYS